MGWERELCCVREGSLSPAKELGGEKLHWIAPFVRLQTVLPNVGVFHDNSHVPHKLLSCSLFDR